MSTSCLLNDFKSSTFKAFEHRIQLGGYYLADMVWNKSLQKAFTKPQFDLASIMYVGPDGIIPTTVMTKDELEDAAQAFLHALEVYKYARKHGQDRQREQRYLINNEPYVSVTQILQYVIAKPGLMGWIKKMVKEGKDPDQIRDDKAAYGSGLHRVLEGYLRGEPISIVTPEQAAVVQKFSEVCLTTGAEVIVFDVPEENLEVPMIELNVFSTEYGFAGTLDCGLKVNTEAFLAWVESFKKKAKTK